MALSQKKSSQNKGKRKQEENLTDKEIAEKISRTKKLKVSNNAEHVLDAKQQKTNVSIKRKSNKQKTDKQEIKVLNKTIKKKIMVLNKTTKKKETVPKMETMKLDEEDNAENVEAKLSKSHIQQCILAMFHLTEKQLKGKNNLLTEEAQPIFMQVTCVKIAKAPRRKMRM